jgi:acylphosphatase
MATVSITVKGKVQGVFFRQTTKEVATRLGLTGEVRNLPNGDVNIIASGKEEQLRLLTVWCHRGPEKAKVDSVDSSTIEERSFPSFKIVR